MSTEAEKERLRSMIASAEGLHANTDFGGLGDGGFSHHVAELRSQLVEAEKEPTRANAKLHLTFSGAPVKGQIGIRADFVAKALGAFQRVVDSVSHAGPLFITGQALGSYGFVLEELEQSSLVTLPEAADSNTVTDSKLAGSVDVVADLLVKLGNAEQEDPTSEESSFNSIQPKMKPPLVEFFKLLADEKAQVTLASRNEVARMSTHTIEWVRTRIDQITSNDRTVVYHGFLAGVLPESRKFEFRSDDQTLIKGVVSGELDIATAVKPYEDTNCNAVFTRTVTEYPSGYTRRHYQLERLSKES